MICHLDPSDVELCHAIANMVAVVLACPPRSNHLWYHMFAADGLLGTHMTGFMVILHNYFVYGKTVHKNNISG